MIGIALMYRGTVSASVSDFGPDYDFEDEMKDLCPTLLLLVLGIICLVICHIINDKVRESIANLCEHLSWNLCRSSFQTFATLQPLTRMPSTQLLVL